MSGPAPVPKPRASVKGQDDDDSSVANLGSPPPFKPPPPRPKTKPIAAVSSNEEPVRSKDEELRPEVVDSSQIEIELDSSKEKPPTKSTAARVAPPIPKGEHTPKSSSDSPKRPAPGPPRQASVDSAAMESKIPPSTAGPSPSLPSGPKHSRSVSTGHKLPSSTTHDGENKSSHSRNLSEHIADDTSPKFTPKRVAPPPPTSGVKGDKKPRDDVSKATVRSESCQSFGSVPSPALAASKAKELRPKEKKAPAVPAPKHPPQPSKPPQKQTSFEGPTVKGTNSPPQRHSPKAVRKLSADNKSARDGDGDGEQVSFSSARDRIKKAGVALPIAMLKEQAEAKRKGLHQQPPESPVSSPAKGHPTEPTISYMDSPMLASDDSSRKVKFSRQLKTWLTYTSEEYDRASNDVNVMQSALLFELEKLIEKMHIYSVQLTKSDNVLGMHIRSQNLNTTPEVGGHIQGIFVSSVSPNSPADTIGSIEVGDLLLEIDGKPMIGSSRVEAMHILNVTGHSVQLTLGRPSSPILKERTNSLVLKDEPITKTDQGPLSPLATKSTDLPTPTRPPVEKMRPRSRSATPEKPKPPPVVHSKPVAPPKPPRVKPRSNVGGAHLSGDQREGQTPTPPTGRDEATSIGQQSSLKKIPLRQDVTPPPMDTQPIKKTLQETPSPHPKEEEKSITTAIAAEVAAVSTAAQKPSSDTKAMAEVTSEMTSLKEENAKLSKDKDDMKAELKASQLKIAQEQAQKEAEWKSTIAQLKNELQEKSDLLTSLEQVKKQEVELLNKRMEESEVAVAENMELLNSKEKESHSKYMQLLGEVKELEKKNDEMRAELETSRNKLQLSEETLKIKETEYQEKMAAMEGQKATQMEPVTAVDETEIERLKEELENVRAEKDREVGKLCAELEGIKEQQTSKDKQMVELNEELSTTRKTLKDNKTSLVALKEDLKSAQSCMDQMQGRNRGLTDQLKEEKVDSKRKEDRMIEITVENKRYCDELTTVKAELEELRKQVEQQKEKMKEKDTQILQQTQIQELSSAQKADTKPGEDDFAVTEIVGDKETEQQYANVDTSSGDILEKKGDTTGSEEYVGPEDYSAPYVNVPVDDGSSDDDVATQEDEDSIIELNLVAKTKTLSSTSQLSKAKVSSTIKRKPPSRGLIRRAAERSDSQNNLFDVDNTADDDYVNLPVNKAVRQQPTQKSDSKSSLDDKEIVKDSDSEIPKEDQIEETGGEHGSPTEDKPPAASPEDKPTVNDKPPVTSNEDKLTVNDKPPVTYNEGKSLIENKALPLVASKPVTKSPVAPVRRHKMGGIPLLPVTQQMEEILSRKRLATGEIEDQSHAMSTSKSAKLPPPVVKKKPVRAPLKSADFLDDDEKSHDVPGGLSRSCENLFAADNDDSFTGSGSYPNKRISASMSVEGITELKESAKPPAVKARKLLPGAVKLMAPKPKEGQIEFTKSPEDDPDAVTPADKDDTSLDRSRPQTPDNTASDSPDHTGEPVVDIHSEPESQATGGPDSMDALLLPDWTNEQVCVWLQRCGLSELVTSVKLGNVTGKVLLELDSNKMKGFGIFGNNERKAFQKEIKSLKSEHERLKKAEKKKTEAEKKQAKKEEKKKKK